MKETNQNRVVYVTTKSYENAIHISRILLYEKLAACSTILQGATSIYEWEGQIEERIECVLMIKTNVEKLETLETRVKELHLDTVPEIISLVIDSASEEYLNWMNSVLDKNV